MRVINPNLQFLHDNFRTKRGVILSGSSRSGKTWSSVDFIIWLCTIETGITINIIKETYNAFKTTLYDDFNRRLPDFGIASPFSQRQEVQSFRLCGNKINLMGADNPSKFHGASCDYFFINEALDVQQDVFDQLEMRCRKFWWMDFNPKFTDHWIYDKIQSRDDVGYLSTTFHDNPNVSDAERRKILSYEPTEDNIRQGTADDYMWNVYGLGLRSAPEGLIFQHVTWIDKFPENIEKIYHGADWGYTNDPTALVKMGVDGENLYLKLLFYKPTKSSNEVIPVFRQFVPEANVWCDSADPGMISDLRRAGLKVFAVNKFHGSINYGISLMKKYKIHIVDCPEWRKEQASYRWREVRGIRLDEPIDGSDHAWSAARYAAISNLRLK